MIRVLLADDQPLVRAGMRTTAPACGPDPALTGNEIAGGWLVAAAFAAAVALLGLVWRKIGLFKAQTCVCDHAHHLAA